MLSIEDIICCPVVVDNMFDFMYQDTVELIYERRFTMSGIIYCITCSVTKKQYVGASSNIYRGGEPKTQAIQRFSKHMFNARNYLDQKTDFYEDVRKYSQGNFNIKILEVVTNLEFLYLKETEWIRQLNTLIPNGYNILESSKKQTMHDKEYMSKKLKGNPKLATYGNLGNACTEETKDKISKANKGRVQTDEEKARRSEIMKASKNIQRKKIKVKETGEIFDSLTDCAVQKFGSKETATNISAVIKERRSHYRGFTFEYV